MIRALPLLAVAALGCSNLTDAGDGVVALDVTVPARLVVEVGDTIQLRARALDRNGDSVAAAITWHTPDSTIAVDSLTGRATGLLGGLPGKIQAAEGALVSDFLQFTVLGRADSLALPAAAADTAAPGVTQSAPLAAQLLGAAGVDLSGHRLIFTVTAPAFADPVTRTVELSNAALADTVLTAADGTPLTPVTLGRANGATAPMDATVSVRAIRPSGVLVPGSDQVFVVTFQ